MAAPTDAVFMGKHPTGFCDQCQIPETVEHVLINCSKYELQRMDMIKDMEKNRTNGTWSKEYNGLQ